MASISIVILLALACAVAIKSGAMKLWHLLLSGIFGFYLASSGAGPQIQGGLADFWTWVGSLHF